MYITRVEQGKSKRYKIYSDNEFLFALYSSEIKQYHIKVDMELSDDIIIEILEEIVYKRAKERALYLLESRPYTCSMMKDKLRSSDYPVCIIEKVILFLQKYQYIDDEAFIRMYVDSYAKSKSKRQIQFDLQKKGISKDMIAEYMSKQDYSEEVCFKKQFERYIRGKDMKNRTVRQKVFRFFYGKGFSYDLIEKYMNANLESIG
ncbi:MAG: regulatory protein RecX [Clostridiales bacterium]|nr:regulatory protein RecX [Clostridiales bacterium]